MRYSNLFLLIFLFFSTFVIAQSQEQNNSSEVDLVPFRYNENWGYSNRQMELVLPAVYYEADFFNEYGLAKVKKRNPESQEMETGYINKAGEDVVKFGKYTYLYDFKDSLAASQRSGTARYSRIAGLLNMWGNEVLSKPYRQLKVMDNGLIWAIDSSGIGVIDRYENIIIPFEYWAITEFVTGVALIQQDRKFGMVNDQGEIVIPIIYDALYEDRFNLLQEHIQKMDSNILQQGLIPAKYGGDEGKWGMINLEGEIIIPFEYDYIGFFVNQVAVVGNNYDGEKKKWGLINLKGEVVLPIEYGGIGNFKYGISGIWRDGKVGFINRKGEDVSPFKYDWAMSFKEGVSIVGISKEIPNTGRYWGLVDTTGQEIIKCQYDKIRDFRDGLAIVSLNDKSGIIDPKGNIVIPLIYQEAFVMFEYVIATKDGITWGVLDTSNNLIVPFKYHLIFPMDDQPGFFRVANFLELDTGRRITKEGYIDLDGNEYFKYDY